tara:strand:- start:43195 stop:43497 length:303 start_codon:yes stop_codon:yes gene_type:complete
MYSENETKTVMSSDEPMAVQSHLETIIMNFKEELSKMGENNYELLNKVDKMVGCELSEDSGKMAQPTDDNIIEIFKNCIHELRYKNDNFKYQIKRLGDII